MEQISVDLIIHCRWLIPVDVHPKDILTEQVLFKENQALVASGGVIVEILDSSACHRKYIAQFEYHLPHHLLMPGLINSHAHSAMSLLRGFADDFPLMTWLEQYIWPAENKHVSPSFVETGTQLAICEMLQSGVTCFNDMYFFPEVVTQTLKDKGLRGCVSSPIIEFPNPWGKNADECIDKATDIVKEYADHPMIHAGFGPHAPYTVSDQSYEKIIQRASDLNSWVHTHLHETESEIQQSINEFAMRPLERLKKLGFFDVRSQAVHMTQIDASDLEILSEYSNQQKSANIVHCPESNLKLASGFCPVDELLQAGVNITLGTDGAASNNDLDLLGEMKTAALLAKAVAKNALALPAYSALYAATRAGALAFGLENLGSLAPNYAADMVALDMNQLNTQPLYDPVAQLVYAAQSHQVSHVWIQGELQFDHGNYPKFDISKLQDSVQHWQNLLKK